MSKDRCDVSGFTFVSPNNGRLYGYNSEGSPCAYSKPVTITIKPTPLVAPKPATELARSSGDLGDRTVGSSFLGSSSFNGSYIPQVSNSVYREHEQRAQTFQHEYRDILAQRKSLEANATSLNKPTSSIHRSVSYESQGFSAEKSKVFREMEADMAILRADSTPEAREQDRRSQEKEIGQMLLREFEKSKASSDEAIAESLKYTDALQKKNLEDQQRLQEQSRVQDLARKAELEALQEERNALHTLEFLERFKPLPMMSHEEFFEKYPGSKITFDHAQLSAQAEAGNFELRGSRLSTRPDHRLELERSRLDFESTRDESLSNKVKPRLKSILASRLEEMNSKSDPRKIPELAEKPSWMRHLEGRQDVEWNPLTEKVELTGLQAFTKSHLSHDKLESEELFAALFGRDNWSRMGARGQAQEERKDGGREERPEEFSVIPFVSAKRYEGASIKMNPYLLQVDVTTIINLDLSHSNMDDVGANIVSNLLKLRSLPNLKKLNVSDNQITPTGEGFLARAMQDKNVQDMILLTKKLDLNAKFIFGTKEEKIAIYKELLQQGAEKGVDTKAIVVDTSFLGMVKNAFDQGFVAIKGGSGFAKCHWNPEELLQAYAEDRLIAKLPTALGKLVGNTYNAHSIVSCYLGATEEAWTSEIGQNVLAHELCVMGEIEYCNYD